MQRRRRYRVWALLAAASLGVLTSCGSAGSTRSTGSASGASAAPASSGDGRPVTLVAVTDAGALVVLDPTDGHEVRRLVDAKVAGDAVQLTPDGATVYYEKVVGCRDEIWKVPVAGGAPAKVDEGSVPALDPAGAKLAYTNQQRNSDVCTSPDNVNVAETYRVVVRDLASGATKAFPMDPEFTVSGLPIPVGHLSWSPDGRRIAVSIPAAQDNEGWRLRTLDPARDRFYLPSDETQEIPVAKDAPRRDSWSKSYYAEGVYLPDGTMLVARRCCSGFLETGTKPEAPESADVMVVDPATGAVSVKLATGKPDSVLDSLDADRSGSWLLFVADGALMVSKSRAAATPFAVGRAFLAADW
jgi:hypothetical protein